jgi:3-hydroxybutyryl-CoA dehydrogenase
MDITGGPALYGKVMERLFAGLCNDTEPPERMRQMMREEFRGTINGRGFYEYAPGDARKWEQRLQEHAWTVHELQGRYLDALPNVPGNQL